MKALEWLRQNPAAVAVLIYLATGILTAAFKPRTDEQWQKMNPTIAGFLKALSAMGLDPVKLVEALVTILKLPSPGDGSKRDGK